MAVPKDDSDSEHRLHWAWINRPLGGRKRLLFGTLRINLEFDSMVDIWMLVAFSLTEKMCCAKY